MIHKTAVIHPSAELGNHVEIGPYCVVGENAKIGDKCQLSAHVVIGRDTTIGKGNRIYPFACVGEDPQDLKYNDEKTQLVMGDFNKIRENVTIHRGTVQDESITSIGDHNLFMATVHVAHDCRIGHYNVFANTTSIAGHVHIDDHVIFSGFCGVHQFCHVGSHAFVARASLITKDVPPYLMIRGKPDASVCGLNLEGIKRRGYSAEQLLLLKRAYRVMYREGLLIKDVIAKLESMEDDGDVLKVLIDFLKQSTRGVVR